MTVSWKGGFVGPSRMVQDLADNVHVNYKVLWACYKSVVLHWLREGAGGRAMSQVMTMGYAGILIGPAIIGFVADMIDLASSLCVVVGALVVLVIGGRFLKTGVNPSD